MRLTTRQSIQLHGILKGDIWSTIHDINASLLSTLSACGDVNRNVMACPAPSANRAQAQVQELAYKLAMHLAPRSKAYHEIWVDGEKVHTVKEEEDEVVEPMYGATYLPRKFKVGIAFPGDNCVDAYTQDIGFIVKLDGEQLTGFTVVLGGGMGMTNGKKETFPLLGKAFADITPDQILQVAETIVTVQRDYGDRTNRKHARMKYVVQERGVDWFKNEVEQRLGYKLAPPSEVHFHDVEDHLGWSQQADGHWFLGLFVENGRIKDTEEVRLREGLRTVIREFQPGIRLTPQQNILLTDIPEDQRSALEARLQEFGISTDPTTAGAYRYAMACPAYPTCGLAVAESERLFPSIVKQFEEDLHDLGLGDERISFRMTGCPNGCARPFVGDVGFVGRSKDLYNIYLGGNWTNTRLSEPYLLSVKTEQLRETLRPLFTLWRDERQPQEAFGDYCHRIGLDNLKEKVAQVTVG